MSPSINVISYSFLIITVLTSIFSIKIFIDFIISHRTSYDLIKDCLFSAICLLFAFLFFMSYRFKEDINPSLKILDSLAIKSTENTKAQEDYKTYFNVFTRNINFGFGFNNFYFINNKFETSFLTHKKRITEINLLQKSDITNKSGNFISGNFIRNSVPFIMFLITFVCLVYIGARIAKFAWHQK